MANNNSLTIISPKEPFKIAKYGQAVGQVIPDTVNIDLAWELDMLTDTHVTKTSPVLFTINEAGLYMINYDFRMSQAGSAVSAQFIGSGMAINGFTIAQSATFLDTVNPGTTTSVVSSSPSISHTARLNVGDTVVGWARNNNNLSVDRSLMTTANYNNITFIRMGD